MRPATAADAAGIADCWRRNYRAQGGVEGLPAALLAARTPESFRARAAARANGDAVVAVAAGGGVVGFCVAAPAGGEIEQLFVDAGVRGAGTAAALLAAGEALLSGPMHLVVTPGNGRAEAFYAKAGWRRAGVESYAADLGGGETLAVPLVRFEKDRPAPGDASPAVRL